MKQCLRCPKPATLHITELRDGGVHELHFCESCAHDYLTNSDASEPSDDADLLAEKLAEVTSEEDLESLDQLVCPICSISFRDFRTHGRLGCPNDYVAFEQELLPLIENIHGETQHAGKYPKRAPDASRRQYELIKLRNELRSAVEEEKYEEAAKLRDEITTLEADLDTAESSTE